VCCVLCVCDVCVCAVCVYVCDVCCAVCVRCVCGVVSEKRCVCCVLCVCVCEVVSQVSVSVNVRECVLYAVLCLRSANVCECENVRSMFARAYEPPKFVKVEQQQNFLRAQMNSVQQ